MTKQTTTIGSKVSTKLWEIGSEESQVLYKILLTKWTGLSRENTCSVTKQTQGIYINNSNVWLMSKMCCGHLSTASAHWKSNKFSLTAKQSNIL